MTIQEVKSYLSQAYYIDKRVITLQDELTMLESKLERCTASYTSIRGGGSQPTFEYNLDKVMKYREMLNHEIDINMNSIDYAYCTKVRELYRNYKANRMTLEQCKAKKNDIIKEYNNLETTTACSKIYLKNQESIKNSELLRAEINKSTDLKEMLLKSLECIAVLTNDETFCTINAKKVERSNKDD